VATNFFENQDRARRKTGLLIFFFAAAVAAIVATLYALAVFVVGFQGQDPVTGAMRWNLHWWSPELLTQVALFTLFVVGGGSLFKIAQLRGGGAVVAERMGGRLLHADTRDPVERKLLNIVEEMAIASGTATPPVYLLDGEAGINAFAAGFTPNDAAIGVTRGCAERLSRDELQGVIAHEFSHVLSGDMRLNIRLIGVVHGILIIGILGYWLLRSAAWSGAASRRSNRDNSGAVLLAIGFGLMVIGFLGTFFGNLIKASVSRQREFFADASAVQFTRNPDGLVGALKKIGGLEVGSRIENPNAPEASHMFFGRALPSLFSTHPPLEERIRRLDPRFEGEVRHAAAPTAPAAADTVAGFAADTVAGFAADTVAGFAADAVAGVAAEPVGAGVDQIGAATPAHVEQAARLIASLPAALTEAAHESWGVRAVIYALLIGDDDAVRRGQLDRLARHADDGVLEETERLLPIVVGLEAAQELTLVDLVIPALRELSPRQYGAFKDNVAALIAADRRIDVFEWTLQRILLQHLAPAFEPVRASRVRHRSLERVAPACAVMLSTLAWAGARSHADAEAAFAHGADELRLPGLRLLEPEQSGLDALDEALAVLDGLAPLKKGVLLHACAATVAADREVTDREVQLVRAISDSLGCPMPPLLAGQALV
jgi:Zn-dependent protease with chaperone function